MAKKYIVVLTDEERKQLESLVSKGRQSARKIKRAHILLLADDGRQDADISKSLHTSIPTVERTRKRFVTGGLDWALNERRRPGAKVKLDMKGEAVLATLAQSEPPEGQKRWTLQLLTDRLVELGVVESISKEAVRKRLKKMN
jgi:transposase